MDDKHELKAFTQALIKKAGGPAAVGRMFDPPIAPQAVSQWVQVPPNRCIALEEGCAKAGVDVTRYHMRPDIYGAAAQVAA